MMLNNKGFDLWADGYDKSTALSDEDGTYPFAGYRDVLNVIYNKVLEGGGKTVLDIGFGTGVLTSKLYDAGLRIYGQDFSEKMISASQVKMPSAKLYFGDFSRGLAEELTKNKYDAVIATYSLHHLTDEQKTALIRSLLPLLNNGGMIYIGDVAFETRADMESCREGAGDEWDEDEIYFIYDEFKKTVPEAEFEKISHCAGVISIGSR